MTQLQQGYDHDSPDTLHGLAYVTFQELATRIAHRNTGRYSDDPVADKIMVRIATDENLHMVFYRDILSAALKLEPSAAVRAIVDEVLAFQMPGAGIPGFLRKAAQIAKAGIYDLRVHRDEVLMPILSHWRIFELTGLDAAAEEARRRLAEHLEQLDEQIARFEERLALSPIPESLPRSAWRARRGVSGRRGSAAGRLGLDDPVGRDPGAAADVLGRLERYLDDVEARLVLGYEERSDVAHGRSAAARSRAVVASSSSGTRPARGTSR